MSDRTLLPDIAESEMRGYEELVRFINGRIELNRNTAAIHPDAASRAECLTRLNVYIEVRSIALKMPIAFQYFMKMAEDENASKDLGRRLR